MSTETKLFITADDSLEVYFDGVASEINKAAGRGDWTQTKVTVLPPGTRVIAVKVTNGGGAAGLVGWVTGDSLVTDENWVCSETAADGWTTPDFDDSKWVRATSQGSNGIAPWGTRPAFSDKAKWIWNKVTTTSGSVPGVLYFRVRLDWLYITADDDLEVYFDGVASEINKAAGRSNYAQMKVVVLPPGTRVIAVKVINGGGAAGLVGSVTGDSLLTDENWVCSETAADGWTKPDFDDSKWVRATNQGSNEAAAWGKRPLISDKAKWIWNRNTWVTPTVPGVLYFRVRLGGSLEIYEQTQTMRVEVIEV